MRQSRAVSSTPESCNIENNAQISLDHADAYYFSVAINDEVIHSGDASGITEIENLTAGFYEVVVDGVCGMEAFSLDLSDSNALNAEIIGEEEVEITETETTFGYEAEGESVQWLLDGVVIGNDNSVEISFENTGDYLLSLSTSNEFCSSTDQMWITVSAAVGLNEHASDDWQVVVLEESLQIQGLRPNSLAMVYNSQGQRILQETSNATSLLIDTSGWAAGIYVIQSQGQTAEIFVGR